MAFLLDLTPYNRLLYNPVADRKLNIRLRQEFTAEDNIMVS